jgi:hypothetical protein
MRRVDISTGTDPGVTFESNRAHFSISAPNLGANVRADFLRDCFGVARLRKRWMRWSQ